MHFSNYLSIINYQFTLPVFCASFNSSVRYFFTQMSDHSTSRYFTRKQAINSAREAETISGEDDSKSKTKKQKQSVSAKSLATDSSSLPSNWKTIYDNIVKMRSETQAVIDTMGCEKCYDTDIDDKVRRFQVLVSLMLSSQTKDQVTFATMGQLKERGLSINFIDSISVGELENIIKSVGFFRRKAEYIKRTASILKEKYDSDIPRTLEELMKLPGVGPKMAHLTMKVAWNEVTGIAVDTHMHRICNRLQWVNTKTPEQTMAQLEQRLPRQYWTEVNHLLVGFGQSVCLPIKPKCSQCLNREICPASTYSF